MMRNRKNKWLAMMLASVMTVSGLPSVPLAAAEPETPKLADFSFDTETDGVLSGGTATAALGDGCRLIKRAGNDHALYLDGATGFLNVTNQDGGSLLAGKENITISYDAKPEKGEASWTFFAAPNTDTQVYPNEHYLGILHTTGNILSERYNNTNGRPGNNLEASATAEWTHVDLVVSETDTKLYVNGEKKAESESDYKLSDIVGANGILQIGKANWKSGEYYKGQIDNYKIYDGLLTEAEIESQYQDFLTRQEEIDKEQNEEQKNEALQKDYDDLEILNADDVRGNLALIKKGRYGSSISWNSSNKDVITDSGEGSLYSGGIVTRPEAGSAAIPVTLTATLSSATSDDTMQKTFDVVVQPKEAALDTDYSAGYLWANFGTHGGYEKIFFGYSEDGMTWKKLNKKDGAAQPILANDAPGSDLGVRDPHLIRSAEGDRYWILGTDLHAEGGGAGGSGWDQLNASQNLVVWESSDLVNWSEPRLVYAGFDNAGCVWAPEAIYDDTTGDYVVYWSSRDKSKANTNEEALRVYVCRTRDFKNFSEPKVWLSEDQDTKDQINIIDTSIVKSDGKFYRFSTSDWNTVVDVSDTLDTEDVLDVRNGEEKSTPNGSWTRLVTRSGSEAAGFDSREGFTVYQLPDGRWCAMGDHGGYKAFLTDDLSTGKFTAQEPSFPDGHFRHGTVVRLSKTEEARVLEAFKDTVTPGKDEEPVEEPILTYDFEQDLGKKTITDTATGDDSKDDGTLFGKAQVVYDEEMKSNVLKLDGSNGSYAELPKGFFDKRNTMSISMDVKSELSSGNFFTFAYGKDSTYYDFLRVRGTEIRNAITAASWESEQEVKTSGAPTGTWQKIVLVFEGTNMKLYVDGALASENKNTGLTTAALGTDILAYLGKSFYSGDAYFKGSFDNFKVYNRALSAKEIFDDVAENLPLLRSTTIGTAPENPSVTMGTDYHTAITSKIDQEQKEITSYVRKNTDLTAVPVTLQLLTKDVVVTVDGKPMTMVEGSASASQTLDLTKDVELTLTLSEDRTETYTLKAPRIARNPVLPGQYADPDIDYFDGKYWIYPTTDGFSGWGGTVFHAWSSKDMVEWEDEGVILDVANKSPGNNEKGVAIAASPWSDGNAWAPSIEEKNGKYYFYYCGNVNSAYQSRCGSGKAIGVAVADNPEGPYVANDMPIVYPKMMSDANIGFSGQVIDPSIFTDDDENRTSYLFFGNGGSGTAMVELNDDMTTVKTDTLKRVNGMRDFRESVVVTKRDGLYHFTWSCDDTGSPNYHVNYGTAEKLDGNVTFHYTLLQKDESGDMLGTAHQSILYLPDSDKCYIAYHRFYTPLGIYTDGLGYHRETCIDEVTFDPETGYMNPLVPTMEGVVGDVNVDPGEDAQETLDKIIAKADFMPLLQNGTITSAGTLALPSELEVASIQWISNNQAVISNNGTVTLPKQDTKVNLTAVFTYKTASGTKVFQVTVKGTGEPVVIATKITLDKKTLTLAPKKSASLKATVTPQNATGKVSWKSSNDSVATVKDGIVTAKKAGTATITASIDGKSASCKVTVKTAVTSVKLNKKSITLGKGEAFTLKATVSPKNATYKNVTWKSSKPKIVSVKNGKITAKATGSSTITATADGKKATCKVTVRKAPKQIRLSATSKKLKKGRTYQIKVKLPSKSASYKITYKSSNKKVATVSDSGKVKAKKKGTATITVKTFNKKTAKIKITVR